MSFTHRVFLLFISCILGLHAEVVSKRQLGGHLFLPSIVMPQPFLTTDIGTLWQGQFGQVTDYTHANAPNFRAVGGGVGFDLQVGVLDWLSLHGSFSGGIRRGFKSDTMRVGINGVWDWSVGARFKLLQTERLIVSTDALLIGNGNSGMSERSLPTFIAELSDSTFRDALNKCATGTTRAEIETACDIVSARLTSSSYKLGGYLGVSAAYGFSPTFGVFSNVGYSHLFKSTTSMADFEALARVGVGLSLDIAHITPVPLGFIFAAQYNYLFNDKSYDYMALSTGIFYTGTQNLSLGLQLDAQPTLLSRSLTGQVVSWTSLALTLRYYWN